MLRYSISWLKSFLSKRGLTLVRTLPSLSRKALLTPQFTHVIAHRMLSSPQFRFIQIGAFDGISGDPIHEFIVRHRWEGILVEPVAKSFDALVRTYRNVHGVECLKVAVSNSPGPRTMYRVASDGDLPKWTEQLSSFDLNSILRHGRTVPGIERYIVEERVECVTLRFLFERLGTTEIDLLQVDVEGEDWSILSQIEDVGARPAILHFECKHLRESELREAAEWLMNNHYRVWSDGHDATAYREG